MPSMVTVSPIQGNCEPDTLIVQMPPLCPPSPVGMSKVMMSASAAAFASSIAARSVHSGWVSTLKLPVLHAPSPTLLSPAFPVLLTSKPALTRTCLSGRKAKPEWSCGRGGGHAGTERAAGGAVEPFELFSPVVTDPQVAVGSELDRVGHAEPAADEGSDERAGRAVELLHAAVGEHRQVEVAVGPDRATRRTVAWRGRGEDPDVGAGGPVVLDDTVVVAVDHEQRAIGRKDDGGGAVEVGVPHELAHVRAGGAVVLQDLSGVRTDDVQVAVRPERQTLRAVEPAGPCGHERVDVAVGRGVETDDRVRVQPRDVHEPVRSHGQPVGRGQGTGRHAPRVGARDRRIPADVVRGVEHRHHRIAGGPGAVLVGHLDRDVVGEPVDGVGVGPGAGVAAAGVDGAVAPAQHP